MENITIKEIKAVGSGIMEDDKLYLSVIFEGLEAGIKPDVIHILITYENWKKLLELMQNHIDRKRCEGVYGDKILDWKPDVQEGKSD